MQRALRSRARLERLLCSSENSRKTIGEAAVPFHHATTDTSSKNQGSQGIKFPWRETPEETVGLVEALWKVPSAMLVNHRNKKFLHAHGVASDEDMVEGAKQAFVASTEAIFNQFHPDGTDISIACEEMRTELLEPNLSHFFNTAVRNFLRNDTLKLTYSLLDIQSVNIVQTDMLNNAHRDLFQTLTVKPVRKNFLGVGMTS